MLPLGQRQTTRQSRAAMTGKPRSVKVQVVDTKSPDAIVLPAWVEATQILLKAAERKKTRTSASTEVQADNSE